MQHFVKLIATAIGVVIVLAACSGTPNNVNMSVNQGQCVQMNQYTPSVQAAELAAFPILANNPKTAPYCVSITLQNNNSGANANPVQTAAPGLIITGLPGEVTPLVSMYDQAAAQIPFVTSPGIQTVGNMALFDPQNCVTLNGQFANTLSPGGPSCTFYLQLLAESYAPGVMPINVSYSYTNGNQNYSLSVNINQRTFLYGGTANGLYFASNSAVTGSSPATWESGISGIPASGNVTSMLADAYGNVYFAVSHIVYIYNGVNASQLGGTFTQTVNSLAQDENGNLYAGTAGAGLFVYNNSITPNAWMAFTDSSGNLTSSSNIIGLKGTGLTPGFTMSRNLYATTESQVFKCVVAESSILNTSCTFTNITTQGTGAIPVKFNPNALAMDESGMGNLYIGSESSSYTYSATNNAWTAYNFNNERGITGSVFGVNYPTIVPTPVYFGEIGANQLATENSVYTCTGIVCIPLISTANHTITGNSYAVTTDGDGDVYVAGSMLNSPDFPSTVTNTFGAYLYVGTTGSTWQPINNGNLNGGNVQSLLVSSILTTY